jgi:hypothetical protein
MAIGRRTARSFTWSLIACGALVVTILAGDLAMASDYRDFRSDPDDPNEDSWNLDSTVRSVWTNGDGRRWLRVIVTPFPYGGYGLQAKVHLDTDGDRTAEFVMVFESWDMSGQFCRVAGQGRVIHRGVFHPRNPAYPEFEGGAGCNVPLSFIKPTSEIAWWVMLSNAPLVEQGGRLVWDRAPNLGWYV